MRKVVPGQIYRHFKGMEVEIILLAKNSEDLSEQVVYKHVNKNEYWVRPLSMFTSDESVLNRNDNKTGQKYRFELIK